MSSAPRILDHKYKLGRVLQQNERALILAATHLELREHVIVKVLDAEHRDPRFAAKLRREARQATAIRSEHVVRYLDIGHLTDGRPYVVMERLVGETLQERLRSGPLPVADAVDAILQTCEALAGAHVRGILHRDLRTTNLFCIKQADSRMMVKVLNFGTGRVTDARGGEEDQGMTVAVLAVDAPDYKSPEQLVSRRDLDSRVDIWALGVVLYELLAGVGPFASESPQEVVRRVLSADLKPAPQIPADVWPVIRRCLMARTEDRWASVADLADALANRATPNTASYPTRIRQILATPPTDDVSFEEEDGGAPTIVGDMLALKRTMPPPVANPAPPPAAKLPRIDDGRTSARSFPWLTIPVRGGAAKAQPDARSRVTLVAVFGVTLLLAVVGLALVIPRFVVDLHVEARDKKGAASSQRVDSPPPPVSTPAPAPTPTPLPSTTGLPVAATAEPAPPPVSVASPTVSASKADRLARAARSAPTTARSGAPAPSTPPVAGDDPWGWQR